MPCFCLQRQPQVFCFFFLFPLRKAQTILEEVRAAAAAFDPRRLAPGNEVKQVAAAEEKIESDKLVLDLKVLYDVLFAQTASRLKMACKACINTIAPLVKKTQLPKMCTMTGSKDDLVRRLLYQGQIKTLDQFDALFLPPAPASGFLFLLFVSSNFLFWFDLWFICLFVVVVVIFVVFL